MSDHDDDLVITEDEDVQTDTPKELPQASSSSGTTSRKTNVRWQTQARVAISPYLPPPVLRAIQQVDPQLEPYVGPEGTVSLLSSFILAWLVWVIIRFMSKRLLSTGNAVDDEPVVATTPSAPYNHTVLLCGPMESGKTRLFYQLCHGSTTMPTVMSLRANVGVSHSIRYMDWPGYGSLKDPNLVPVMKAAHPRIVLVLDATQSVSSAADCLDELLTVAQQYYSTKNPLAIFVACHKNDLSKAKNAKRVRLQMRTELERLLKSRGDSITWWSAGGEQLELDDLKFVKLSFCATSCEGVASPELVVFCQSGKLPSGQ